MKEINPIEFGEMKSDLKHVRESMDNHTVVLDRIEEKLNKFATRSDLKVLEKRIGLIEERNRKIDGNIFMKAIAPGEKKVIGLIVKVTGIGMLAGAVFLYVYTQSNTQQLIIKKINEETAKIRGKE